MEKIWLSIRRNILSIALSLFSINLNAETIPDITKGNFDFLLSSNKCVSVTALTEPDERAISVNENIDIDLFCSRNNNSYKCAEYIDFDDESHRNQLDFKITADSPPYLHLVHEASFSIIYVNLNTRGAVYERRNTLTKGLVTITCNSLHATKHELDNAE